MSICRYECPDGIFGKCYQPAIVSALIKPNGEKPRRYNLCRKHFHLLHDSPQYSIVGCDGSEGLAFLSYHPVEQEEFILDVGVEMGAALTYQAKDRSFIFWFNDKSRACRFAKAICRQGVILQPHHRYANIVTMTAFSEV